MDFNYCILPERKFIAIKYSGVPTVEEIFAASDALIADPNFCSSFNGVSDWRDVISNLKPEEVKQLSSWAVENDSYRGRWVALVAEPMVTAYAMIFAQNVRKAYPLEVYGEVSSASKYLQIDVEPILRSLAK